MILDTSAIMSVLNQEEDASLMTEMLSSCREPVRISAGTLIEAYCVVESNRDPVFSSRLDDLLREAGVVVEPVTERQSHLAREALLRFGRGHRHPAKLNFGDLFAYALARDKREPLLFKGDDFSQTDLYPAVKPRPEPS